MVLDAADAERLAAFYAQLTGWPSSPGADGLALQSPAGPALAFQSAPDHVPPEWPGQDRPHQMHLDLDVPALAPAAARAVALGATEIGAGGYWRTLTDPAGHPFDLCQNTLPPMSRLWVSIDVPDPSVLAHFYSGLLGLEITHDNEAGAAISAGPLTVFFQPVTDYRAPRWPDPAHPQQAHLDVQVEDLDAAVTWATERGAELLADQPGGPVLADPAGHPFCLKPARWS
jgi:predicted enzyme related to lactoylglutathione lyase